MKVLLVLLAFLPQEKETIPKAQKQAYSQSAKECEKAAGMIDSDPAGAIELLDGILSDRKVEKRECRLRWEISAGTYSRWYDFFPYQYRGRARTKSAANSDDKDEKESFLRGAVKDLEESVRLGLNGSNDYLKIARADLKALTKTADPVTDPEPEFRRTWTRLLDRERFADAKKHITTQGGFLKADQKKKYEEDTDSKCREFLDGHTGRFRQQLERISGPEDIKSMIGFEFNRDFELPYADDLSTTTPAYDWCRKTRSTLQALRNGEEVVDRLFDQAVTAIALVPKGDSPWFHPIEGIAYQIIADEIDRRARDARGVSAEERRTLRSEAESLGMRWKSFSERVTKAAEKRPEFTKKIPKRDFSRLFDKFPQDAEGVDKIIAALDACVHAEDPDTALRNVELQLGGLYADKSRLTVESRRTILNYMIVASSLRGLIAEETPSDISSTLGYLRDDLKRAGGVLPEIKKYGPKVEKVFEQLR